MRRIKPQPIRNRLDLADVRQVRSMMKRLRLSWQRLQRDISLPVKNAVGSP